MALELSPAGRRYGAHRSKPNSSDKIGLPDFIERLALPPKLSIEAWAPPIKDQGELGSCTAHGGSSYREFLFRKYHAYEKFKDKYPDPNVVILSPTAVYYWERETEGDLGQGDTGAQVVTSMFVIDTKGAALLANDPYPPDNLETPPTAAQTAEALEFKGGAYHRLNSVLDIKHCIASGYPVVVGFDVYESFEDDAFAKNGLMPMPDTNTESILGGHEILGGLAYDDTIQCPNAAPGAVLMQNSWGVDWGISGRFWMPYQFLNNPSFVSDIWMQHLGPAWVKKAAAPITQGEK